MLYLLELAWALKRLLRVMLKKYRSRKVYRCRTVSRERTNESAIGISFAKLTIYCDGYTVLFTTETERYSFSRTKWTGVAVPFFYRSITRATTILRYGIRNFFVTATVIVHLLTLLFAYEILRIFQGGKIASTGDEHPPPKWFPGKWTAHQNISW